MIKSPLVLDESDDFVNGIPSPVVELLTRGQ